MKLLLVNGKDIIVQDVHEALSGKDKLMDLDLQFIKDTHLYRFEYSINGSEFENVENKKVPIPESIFKEDSVIIMIRMIKLTDDSVTEFLSDKIPVTHYVTFGKEIIEAYPRVISKLLKDTEVNKHRLNILENKGDIF